MQLKVFLPTEILLDQKVGKVIARAPNGSFAILPRHIDFVAALVPSVLIYTDSDGAERFLGIDEDILDIPLRLDLLDPLRDQLGLDTLTDDEREFVMSAVKGARGVIVTA